MEVEGDDLDHLGQSGDEDLGDVTEDGDDEDEREEKERGGEEGGWGGETGKGIGEKKYSGRRQGRIYRIQTRFRQIR